MQVTLPDGSVVLAHGRLDFVPVDRPRAPDFALYLDARWEDDPDVRWPHRLIEWPDFGVPTDKATLFGAITDLHRRARSNELVEVACYGGIGRTGTVVACLAGTAGIHAGADAVAWARNNYHASAVETPEQESLVAEFIETLSSS
jgi:protein-tyrosine phosphatase